MQADLRIMLVIVAIRNHSIAARARSKGQAFRPRRDVGVCAWTCMGDSQFEFDVSKEHTAVLGEYCKTRGYFDLLMIGHSKVSIALQGTCGCLRAGPAARALIP